MSSVSSASSTKSNDYILSCHTNSSSRGSTPSTSSYISNNNINVLLYLNSNTVVTYFHSNGYVENYTWEKVNETTLAGNKQATHEEI